MSDAATLRGRSSLALADRPVSPIASGRTPPAPFALSIAAGRQPRSTGSTCDADHLVGRRRRASSAPGDYVRALSGLATSLPLSETRRPPVRGHPQHRNTPMPGARRPPVTRAAKWHLPGIAKDEKSRQRRVDREVTGTLPWPGRRVARSTLRRSRPSSGCRRRSPGGVAMWSSTTARTDSSGRENSRSCPVVDGVACDK